MLKQKRLFNLIIIGVIILGYGYLLFTSFPDAEQTICLFKRVTTIPCPGCGMGRSTWSLLHGQITQSFFYHPLGILFNVLIIAAVIQATIDLIRDDDRLIRFLKRPWPLWSLISLLLVIMIVWARNIYIDM